MSSNTNNNRTGKSAFNRSAAAYATQASFRQESFNSNITANSIKASRRHGSDSEEDVKDSHERSGMDSATEKSDLDTSDSHLNSQLEAISNEKKIVTKLPPLVVEVMDEIRKNWVFTMNEQYNPLPHALTLLDTSSQGRDYKTFDKLYTRLEAAMDLIVNEYHQGFNSAIQKFSGVVENITDSQAKVIKIRESLMNSKSSLGSKSQELFHLWLKINQYNEMVKIMDKVDDFIQSSNKVHYLLQEKFYWQASKLIVLNLKDLNTTDYKSIGALSDIREKFETLKSSLPEKLVEELNAHIYFKTPSSMERFHKYEEDNAAFQSILYALRSDKLFDQNSKEDFDTDPESNSFEYIKSILMACHSIGCLNETLKATRERISSELYFFIARIIADVEENKPQLIKQHSQNRFMNFNSSSSLMSSSHSYDFLSGSVSSEDELIFNHLIRNLFKKLYGVIQGYFFIYTILEKLQSHDPSLNVSDEFQIRDLWMLMQNEVKAFLYDHLSTTYKASEKPVTVVESFGLTTKSSHVAKQLIQVTVDVHDGNLDIMYDALQNHDDRSNPVVGNNKFLNQGGLIGVIDRYANQLATSHRVIIKPDTYLVILAFLPTQKFVQKVESLIESNMGMLENFLNDFILSVYIPQLQDRVALYIQTYVHSIDAFQTEFSAHSAAFPLCKSSIAVISLIKGLCRAISLLPVNQEECIDIIESTLKQYYEKAVKKFYTTLREEKASNSSTDHSSSSEPSQSGVISFNWAQNEELVQILKQKMAALQSKDGLKSLDELNYKGGLSYKEAALESRLKGDRSFHRSELIFETRKLQTLAHLHYSMDWVVNQLNEMLQLSEEEATSPTSPIKLLLESTDNTNKKLPRRNTNLKSSVESFASLAVSDDVPVGLPIFEEAKSRYQIILYDFQRLADISLYTLRLEFRSHAIYFLDLAIREGNYYLTEEASEPDPYIWALNSDLTTAEETMIVALPKSRIRFIFDGMAHLVAHILITNAKYIKRLNQAGIQKLVKNVQSLQQSLTNVVSMHEKDLDKAKQYYNLLVQSFGGGKAILAFMEAYPGKFAFDEYKTIFDLLYDDALNEEDENGPGRQEYAYCIKKTKEHFLKVR